MNDRDDAGKNKPPIGQYARLVDEGCENRLCYSRQHVGGGKKYAYLGIRKSDRQQIYRSIRMYGAETGIVSGIEKSIFSCPYPFS